MSEMYADVVEEGRRLGGEAADRSIRLLGGVAIRLRSGGTFAPAFDREYADLDFIVPKGGSREARKFFEAQGYVPQTRFNALYGSERLLFFDEANGRQVDVLVGKFRMCHEIPFGKRLDLEAVTVPLAELLLTKLQIVELNEKDVRDTLALLHDHDVSDADGDTVNGKYVAGLCAADWGLWRTITGNLDALGGRADDYEISGVGKERIEAGIRSLQEFIGSEPKSFGWRVRSKLGERKRWYELPEEVEGGP